MMKQLTIIFCICFLVGCSATTMTTSGSSGLNGMWKPVSQELGGKALPKAAFETQKLIIDDSTYIVSAESVDKGIIQYKDDKMDIYGREGVNAGKHFTAMYKLENEQLIICYNLSGDGYPVAFETKGKPMYFLSVFKKESGN